MFAHAALASSIALLTARREAASTAWGSAYEGRFLGTTTDSAADAARAALTAAHDRLVAARREWTQSGPRMAVEMVEVRYLSVQSGWRREAPVRMEVPLCSERTWTTFDGPDRGAGSRMEFRAL